MQKKILANAELVRQVAKDQLAVTVNYDEAGVRWLNQFIDGQRAGASEAVRDNLVHTLGSFLGECIRQTHGGQWAAAPDSAFWLIRFSDGNAAYPFNLVRKQLEQGGAASVLSFFRAIPALFPDAFERRAASRPWWRVMGQRGQRS